jgi:hypothetical protein
MLVRSRSTMRDLNSLTVLSCMLAVVTNGSNVAIC